MKRLVVEPDDLPAMSVGLLMLDVVIPASTSLKEKRSVILSLFSRLRRTHNVAVSEVGERDLRDRAFIAVVTVNSDKTHCNTALLAVERDVERQVGLVLSDFTIEFL